MKKMDERILMGIVASTFVIVELWTLIHDAKDADGNPIIRHPFPFSDQGITKATYIWMVCVNGAQCLIMFVFSKLARRTKFFYESLFVMAFLYFLEFFFNYNRPWFLIGDVPVNITTIRYLVIIFSTVYTVIKWRTLSYQDGQYS